MFTGSTRVGRMVMKAAAENLVPVTLELGGKSPTVIHPDYPIDKAVARIVFGKFYNGGQTCIGVDYLLVHKDKLDATVAALQKEIRERYPTIANNPDYNAIATQGHYRRVTSLVESAVQAGATAIEVKPEGETLDPASRLIAPTLLTGVTDEMAVMQEEIFGPVLPIVPFGDVAEAVRYINARPRPLAFYYFDTDRGRADQVLRSTLSGSACVNECVLQYVQDDIPFGGVGASGMGAYHGREGFETFSHKRSVFYQGAINVMGLQAPPHGARMERLLRYLFGG
jgi:acyl-CoA reductase-like NAD-dependent aldehyde dehydrogenase